MVLEAVDVAAAVGDLDGSRLLRQECDQLRSVLEGEQDRKRAGRSDKIEY